MPDISEERRAVIHIQGRYVAGTLPAVGDADFWSQYPSVAESRRQAVLERGVRIANMNQALAGPVGNPTVDELLYRHGLKVSGPGTPETDNTVSTLQVMVLFTSPQGGSRRKQFRLTVPPSSTGSYIGDMIIDITGHLRDKYKDAGLTLFGTPRFLY